jgi:hypothetical protein
MKKFQKSTAVLALLSSTLILQSVPAIAETNLNNQEKKLVVTADNDIAKNKADSISVSNSNYITNETTTGAAVRLTAIASTITLNDLKNKIDTLVTKVEEDKKSGVIFADKKLEDIYLDLSQVDDTLSNFDLKIQAGKQLIAANSTDGEAIKAAYNAIDTAYNSLRTLKKYSSFSGTDGEVWKDTNGVPIQAHGGQVQWLEKEGKWYWYGEDKTKGYRSNGISAYSSKDLYNWTFEGYVMRTISNREELDNDPYFSDLYKDYTKQQKDNVYLCFNDSKAVIERPKMIYNKNTGKYVLWFHADGPTAEAPNSNYAAAAAGVAISDSPNGPFKFLGRYRLNVCPPEDKKGEWYESSAGFARDMNLWVDDDGTAYIIYSSEENRTMFISKLNDEYTNLATPVNKAVKGKDFVRLFPGAQREAPALFKYNNKYYMITSSATGWDPNQAKYWVADDILGEWTDMGDPCIDDKDKKTFYSQSTNVINVDKENGKFIYMGDRWKANNLGDSRYVWLPLEFDYSGKLLIKPYTNWKLKDLDNKYTFKINSELKETYTGVEELPKTLSIKVYENGSWIDKVTTVKWNLPDIKPMAKVKVTGVLEGINKTIDVNVVNIPSNLKYYIDCGAKSNSKLYDLINNKVQLTNNQSFDQAYTQGSWGYLGKIGTDINFKNANSTDDYDNGLWAYKDKKIEYAVPLKAGNYNLYAGFNEWWGAYRTMGISISYKNSNGETVNKDLGTFTNNAKKDVNYTFNLPNASEVKVSVYKPNSNNPDVILSWLALEAIK